MNYLNIILSCTVGLVLCGCGGAAKQAADPSSRSETSVAERTETDSSDVGSSGTDGSDRSKSKDSSDAAKAASASALSEARDRKPRGDSEDAEDEKGPDEAPALAHNQHADAPDHGKHQSERQNESHDGSAAGNQEFGDCLKSNSGLVLTVDRKTVSLEEGRLQAKMDGPICSLVMRIMRKDGQPTIEKSFRYTGPESELRWDPVPRDQIEKIELRITAKDHAYQAVLLIPWSVAIDHKEVQFDTNKAVIRDSEVPKLTDSLAKIREVLAKVEGKDLGTVTLFIAGHTDTQGSDEHNMTLSRNRAQAIAAWFVKQGLCVPIAFEGFGETALKKLTADNVDEQANRRVDYILAVEPPVIKKGANPAWKWISKGC